MSPHAPASALEIARQTRLLPIDQVAAKLGISADDLEPYGKFKAKVSLDLCKRVENTPAGRLVLVSAINPTPAGEGKTTTSIGLCDGLTRLGKKAAVCLREPSLGPCFGIKGGGAGGGRCQVAPMEDINLHFTGDFHAVGAAHNLLAALVDNHLNHGNRLGIDVHRVVWRRLMDMNDRALREIIVGLGGMVNGLPRETGFDITPASEIMAILCFSESLWALRQRLGQIIAAYTREHRPITAQELKAHGAMTVLLRDAIKPNLVQTLEGSPAFVHCGPFGNIAHGCNSILANKLSLHLAEYTVTEAGFGADLGAEKYFNIHCRKSGLRPDAVVVVATIRALKYHGSTMKVTELSKPNLEALKKGLGNLGKHIENLRKFGLPVVAAVNQYPTDTDEDWHCVQDFCGKLGVPAARADHFVRGGAGAESLAHLVIDAVENGKKNFQFLYPDNLPLWEKAEIIAREIYGADGLTAEPKIRARFNALQDAGYGHFPICMAKTQYSLSADPLLRGRPSNFTIPIREVRLAAGAEFVVVLTGDIMTMPGLPKEPAAEKIDVDQDGRIVGLF